MSWKDKFKGGGRKSAAGLRVELRCLASTFNVPLQDTVLNWYTHQPTFVRWSYV